MSRNKEHSETHLAHRIGWLRAAVLGANDGIISTSSLIVGVAAATPDRTAMLIAGAAGLAAGAMSMAAGEYVSVSSQSDTEKADLAIEQRELKEQPEFELQELTNIYVARGLDPALAREVAGQLTAKDALGTHAREELGITEISTAQPVLAAVTSAITFAAGAAAPMLLAIFAPLSAIVPVITGGTLVFLALLGALGAYAGGANLWRGALRVTFWGAMAMAATAIIGRLVGHAL